MADGGGRPPVPDPDDPEADPVYGDDRPRGDARALLAWSLPAFHAALLVALLALGLFLAGVAGDALSGLDTAVGLAAYLYLWAITWWTNRRWLEGVGDAMVAGRPDPRPVAVGALRWGGATGLSAFVAPFAVAAAFLLGGGGVGAVPFVLLAGLVGAALSFAVGAVVGTLFAGLDLALLRAAAAVAPGTGEATDSD